MMVEQVKADYPVEVVRSIPALRHRLALLKQDGERIALVPTMGNLHAGHLSLVTAANRQASCTIVSIFVNPLQFSPDEDFSTYPRTLDEDISKLALNKQSSPNRILVFAPAVDEIYPAGEQQATFVEVPGLSARLEGRSRPGFFRGVATVVNKLFNIVQPDMAFFGEKDYQQLLVIRQMVQDLALPVEICSVPTIREADGLAMSSRNHYLTEAERSKSSQLYQALQAARDLVLEGVTFADAETRATRQLTAQGFEVDYLRIREPHLLRHPQVSEPSLIILAAARLGKTRLIDNLLFAQKRNH